MDRRLSGSQPPTIPRKLQIDIRVGDSFRVTRRGETEAHRSTVKGEVPVGRSDERPHRQRSEKLKWSQHEFMKTVSSWNTTTLTENELYVNDCRSLYINITLQSQKQSKSFLLLSKYTL